MSAAANTGAQVLLSFSVKDIPSLDLLSKSDPFLVVYSVITDPQGHQKRTRVFDTEVVMNNEDAVFQKKFSCQYLFEVEQRYVIECYDSDTDDIKNLADHDYIGEVDILLSNVMSAFQSTLSVQMKDKSGQPVHKIAKKKKENRSFIIIKGDQLAVSRFKFAFRCSGLNYPKGSFFSKDDTFIEFCKAREDAGNELFAAYTSNTVQSSQSPVYQPGKVDLANISSTKDLDGSFILRAVRDKGGGKREIIGQATVSILGQLCKRVEEANMPPGHPIATCNSVIIPLLTPKGKEAGSVRFDSGAIKEEFTFLDYLAGGLDITFQVAIDLTGSNGPVSDPKSLHYIHNTQFGPRNQYIDALRAVGGILANYTSKQFIPLMGFGAHIRIPGLNNGSEHTSHCFPLSLDLNRPFANGVEDCVQIYCQSLPRLQLSGPTYFKEIITAGMHTAMRPYTPDYQHFNIVLILTDGVLNDTTKVVDTIVQASDTPMSIIIVGIGNSNWDAMEALDSDDALLKSSTGQYAKHDIVQFTPFQEFMNNPQELARQVLAEIPGQVTTFMNMHNIAPIVRTSPPLNTQSSYISQGEAPPPY